MSTDVTRGSGQATISEIAGNILVVEDQFEVQQAISMLLATLGHEVAVSSTPEEALEIVSRKRFDLILLDLNYRRDTTSGAEGLQLLSLLRSRGIDAPVIAMTAWGSIDVAVQAMHSGACDFLQKPWDNAHLSRLVDQQLRLRRERQHARRLEEREWEDAVEVQRRLLPREFPQIDGISIAAVSRPLGLIGGDYYDVFSMGDKVAICIGDVVGKGVPAALMMSNLQAAVKVTAAHWVSPAEVCSRVNHLACSNGASDKFISFFYAVIDRQTHRLDYCNCGHNAPILHRTTGLQERLETGGTLLGLSPQERYREGTLLLGKGDRLLLFTDGLCEAENHCGEAFGEDRLAALLQSSTVMTANQVLKTAMDDVESFCGSRFGDDVTCMVVAVDGF